MKNASARSTPSAAISRSASVEERVPVAVAEVDRQVDAVGVELDSESRDQRPVLGVDRADAAEELVVMRDLLEPLAGDVAPARDVLEERDHVVHPLRPAERDDEDRVEARGREGGDEPVGGRLGNGLAHRSERSRARLCSTRISERRSHRRARSTPEGIACLACRATGSAPRPRARTSPPSRRSSPTRSVFRSPAVFKPYEGRDAVAMLLATVVEVFEDFSYTDQVETAGTAILAFSARVGDRDARRHRPPPLRRPGQGLRDGGVHPSPEWPQRPRRGDAAQADGVASWPENEKPPPEQGFRAV